MSKNNRSRGKPSDKQRKDQAKDSLAKRKGEPIPPPKPPKRGGKPKG